MKVRRRRKSWSVIFGLLLTVSLLLAACGGSNSGKGSQNGSGGTSANSGSAAFGGEQGASRQESQEPIVVDWLRYEHPNQAVVTDSVAVQEILKRKNIKINLQSVPQSNYDDKKKTLIATNTIPDVILVDQSDVATFADSGIFLDLTLYLEQGKMPNLAQRIKEVPDVNKLRVDGKLYGFPMLTYWNFYNGQLPMIRTDVLNELGLTAPTTYDELFDVLKAIKQAYPDSYPFTTRAANGKNGTQALINPIAFGFGSGYTNITGTPIYYDPKDDAYKFGPFAPEFKEAIAYLHKLYNEKLLDPDYAVNTSQIWQEKLSSNKAFFFMDNTGFATNFMSALRETDPDATFDVLPALTAPNGARRTQLYNPHNMSDMFAITARRSTPINWSSCSTGCIRRKGRSCSTAASRASTSRGWTAFRRRRRNSTRSTRTSRIRCVPCTRSSAAAISDSA